MGPGGVTEETRTCEHGKGEMFKGHDEVVAAEIRAKVGRRMDEVAEEEIRANIARREQRGVTYETGADAARNAHRGR
jgi:hypothetical protein